MASSATAQNFGEYGSFVNSVGASDLAPLAKTDAHTDVGVAFCIGYVDDPDETGPSRRAWFFHIATDGGCDTSEQVENSRSYRITEFGGSANAKWITDSDTDYTGKSFDQIGAATGASWLCYLESDGIKGYSLGDPVYVDTEKFHGSSGGTITVHDLRLAQTSSGNLAPFSVQVGIVESGDSDLSQAGDTSDDPTKLPTDENYTCGSFDAAVFDLGTQSTFDKDDLYYLDHADLPDDPAAGTNELRLPPGTVRVTKGDSLSGGEKVTDGDADHRPFLEQIASGDVMLAATSASSTPDKSLYFHFTHPDTTDDVIMMHDVVLKGSSGTSSSSPGQVVTSDTHAGTPIDTTESLADHIFYIDEDSDGSYDLDENVYIKHPDSAQNTPTSLQVNDIRLDTDQGNAGSLVESGDEDYSTWKSASVGNGFTIKVENPSLDDRTPLESISNANYLDEDDDSTWDPSTEDVFLGSVTNDSNETAYTRVWDNGAAADTTFRCPKNGAPCGSQKLTSTSNVRTTGPDSDYEPADDEFLYWSEDDHLTVGDYGLNASQTPNGKLTTSNHLDAMDLQPNDVTLYASHDDCSPVCFSFQSPGDLELATNYGERLDSSSSGIVPEVSVRGDANQRVVRHDYGSSGLTEDTYYLDLSNSQDFRAASVLRLTPFKQESRPAGAFLSDSFSTETQTSHEVSSTEFYALIGYIESGSQSGFGTGDFLYFDLPQDLGATASNVGVMSQWDARMNGFTFSGTSFDAGSRVLTSDADHQSFSGDSLTDKGATNWQILYWDADLDGAVDDDDFLWLHKGNDGPSTPTFLDLRLAGSGGATDSGGTGGGGGGDSGTTEDPPSISITSPNAGAQIDPGATVSISGSADGGSDSISSVSVTVNGQSLTVTGTSSWSTSWTAPNENGTYTITATVTDSESETSRATRGIQVGQVGEDSDGDGVLDENDNCPNTANEAQTDTDGDGTGDACDRDTDGDGLFDSHDECPTEVGPINNNGCPRDGNETDTPDTDGDGVADPSDECPHDPGPRENDGCPETNETGNETDQPEETPAAGLIAVLVATISAVLIRRD